MGNWLSLNSPPPPPPPPPMVLVPPLFDFPPLAARTRSKLFVVILRALNYFFLHCFFIWFRLVLLESSYNMLFGKLALKCLFEDYFEEARHFSTRIMLKPIEDPHVDLIATVSGPLDHKPDEKIVGNAQFRWQSDVLDPHTFIDLSVSNSEPTLVMRSCAYHPKFGFGAFGIFPLILKQRKLPEDYGIMGLRYGSPNLSVGATFVPFSAADELPKTAWLVSKMGRLTAGVQYEPTCMILLALMQTRLLPSSGSPPHGFSAAPAPPPPGTDELRCLLLLLLLRLHLLLLMIIKNRCGDL